MNSTRIYGLKYVVMGIIITVGFVLMGDYFYGERNWTFIGYGFAVPGGFALAGLMQLITGIPFLEMSKKWDSLAGWQRGILGVLIFIFSCLVIGLCLATYAITMYS